MNRCTKFISKGALGIWLFFIAISLHAQEKHRVFSFNTGDEYQTEMLTNSSAILTRGKQTLNINSVTTATKSYKIISSTAQGYSLNVEIKKMVLSLEALGKKLEYNSELSFDSTSTILKALDFMIKKPINLGINKNGIIQASTDYRAEMATDTLVSFAGLQPEVFEKGTLFTILADITYNKSLVKGYTWADSVEIDKQKLKTVFTIEEITENNTIVKFTSSILGKLINSNINGTYVIDNITGLINEKLFYSKSIGYMISAGNTVYAVSRSTSVTERTKKVSK
jgi:hypothetical protein